MALPIADRPPPNQPHVELAASDDRAQPYTRAAVEHQPTMGESQAIARAAEQARRLATATPVYGSHDRYPDSIRARVNWSLID